MIIERARELAVRAPARVVFPDALDERVLKAAHYLQQCGLARPVLVASPFALRQFALSHRMAMDGIQVIDPHSVGRQLFLHGSEMLQTHRQVNNDAAYGRFGDFALR